MSGRVLTDVHRMFLQVMMSRRVLSNREIHQIYSKLESESDTNLTSFLSIINKKLEPLSMSIVKGKEEDTGHTYYALVNISPDAASKLANDFTPAELEYFRKVVEVLVNSDNGTAGSISLMNISTERKLTKTDAQSLLKRLTKEKWLTSIEDTGHYAPGIRFILELMPFLRETFGDDDIFKCPVCSALVIRGEVCTGCSARIHLYCAEKLFGDRGQIEKVSCSDILPTIDSQGITFNLTKEQITSSASCPSCRCQLHQQHSVPASRKRSTRESTASMGSYSEVDDGLTPSGSGLSMQEVNQALSRGSRHTVKHPRR